MIPLEAVSSFIRQLAHDLHNDLNALDLAATYVGEIVEDPSAREELATQRETIHSMSKVLHAVSLHLQPPNPSLITLPAADLVDGFRERISHSHPAETASLSWSADVGTRQIAVDFEMACAALAEIFKNAIASDNPNAAVTFCASLEGETLHLLFARKIATQPEAMDRLGREPFLGVKRRNYGIGLFYAARVAEAHGGRLETRYDGESGLFRIEMALPLKGGELKKA